MAIEMMSAAVDELKKTLEKVSVEQTEAFEQLLLGANRVFCYGLGRSGLNARAFGMRLMHMGKEVYIVGDTVTPSITEGDVLLTISASGSSRAMACIAEKAKGTGAKMALITGRETSGLAEFADVKLLIPAPTKVDRLSGASVVGMGSLFEESTYILCDLMVLDIMKALNTDNDIMMRRHANLE